MFARNRLLGTSLFMFVLFSPTLAQEKRALTEKPLEPVAAGSLVTATATVERVRITAPASVVQMHVEVYASGGEKLFDNEIRGGNIFDWHLQDGQAQRLTAGDYVCVVTVKNISGKITQRIGTVTLGENTVSVAAADSKQLFRPQAQAIGPVEENASWTILVEQENQTTTVVAHDGTDGQLVRGRGALSFRLGDFFSGKDEEQMRLTEDGNLGLGTDKPVAKLDVAGAIRARQGFVFGDGSTLNVNDKGALTMTDAKSNVVPNVSGTGTQNNLAKWTDNSGTLGDSAVTETGGSVGIGTNSPASLLHLAGPAGVSGITLNTPGTQRFRFQTVPSVQNWGALTLNANYNSGWLLDDQNTNGYFFKLDTRGGNANGPNNGLWLYRVPSGANPHVDETPIFGVSSASGYFAGNVGIGTIAPGAKLDVAGGINTSTQFNIRGNRVLSVTGGGIFTNTNTFAGVDAGLNNTATSDSSGSGNVNSFFGSQAGASNTTGSANSFFGEEAGLSNVDGIGNSVFGRAAAQNLINGNFNSHFGTFAGAANFSGSNNTYIGAYTNSSGTLTNATAIGYQAMVTQSNSLILGSINGTSNGGAVDTNVGIGTTAPARRLHVNGTGSDGAGQTDLRITGTGQIASGITLESTGTGGRTYSWLSTADNTGGGGSGPGRLAVFDVTA
ncbi:MAG: hypothetical protein ABJC10_12580, partial [Acidobacteriota bacterium]